MNSPLSLNDVLSLPYYADRYEQGLSIFRTNLQGGTPSNETAVASIMGDFISHYMKILVVEGPNSDRLGRIINYLDAFSLMSGIKNLRINRRYCVTKTSAEHLGFRGLRYRSFLSGDVFRPQMTVHVAESRAEILTVPMISSDILTPCYQLFIAKHQKSHSGPIRTVYQSRKLRLIFHAFQTEPYCQSVKIDRSSEIARSLDVVYN